jgi:Fe2+ transport system protein B
MYLLILDYESDAERKRIDYAIERWQHKLKISKPKGTIIVIDGKQDRIDEFVEDLCSRLEKSEEKVKIHNISSYSPDIEKNIKKITYQTKEQREFLEKFIDYLMAKLSASYEYSSKIGKIYKVYTKKGQAKVEIILQNKETGTDVHIAIDGYGEVVDFISVKIDNEMSMFLGGK